MNRSSGHAADGFVAPAKTDLHFSDEEIRDLLARVAARDKKACEVLVRRYQPALTRFARRRLRDTSAAEDLVQEAFLSVWRKADVFRHDSSFYTYLCSIVKNLACTLNDKSGRQVRVEDQEDLIESLAEPTPGVEQEILESSQQGHRLEILERCREHLSEKLKVVTEMTYKDELPLKEVSVLLDLPEGTVKSRLHQARQRMLQCLKRHKAGPHD